MSLSKKTDLLGYSNAYHLLRRTTYRITKDRILAFANLTPDQALAQLLVFSAPVPFSPLNNNGETYIPTVDNPTITDTLNTTQGNYETYWWIYQAMNDNSMQYKIAYLLHLFFVTDDSANAWTNFDYKELLRFHTNGSIKDLAIRMTSDPRMLAFLNNNVNKKNSPNQNYAREFLELITILKGPQIDTGNYTNYTELDVQQAAKVFTGFTTNSNTYNRANRLLSVDPITKLPKGVITVANHDTGNKTFSPAFGSAIINGANTDTAIQAELESFITMVFNQNETAKAYCRKMYRYFVGRDITPTIEQNIIVPLSTTLKSNNYNLQPVLIELLTSKHFYDEEDAVVGDNSIGALVRSPLELYLHMFSLLGLQTPVYSANPSSLHSFLNNVVFVYSYNSGLPIFRPQSVNGYAGYSSSPNFDKNFITTSTLRIRYNYSIDFIINGLTYNGFLYKLNLPNFVKTSSYFSNPSNTDTLIADFLTLLFVAMPPPDRVLYFKTIFLNGLSTINWTNEWNNFINTGTSTGVKIPIDRLVKTLIKSPEFQTF
jgi:uncharacterized protein (DUF1800 family)